MQKPPHANNIWQKQDTVLYAVDSLEPLLMIVKVLSKISPGVQTPSLVTALVDDEHAMCAGDCLWL